MLSLLLLMLMLKDINLFTTPIQIQAKRVTLNNCTIVEIQVLNRFCFTLGFWVYILIEASLDCSFVFLNQATQTNEVSRTTGDKGQTELTEITKQDEDRDRERERERERGVAVK